MADKVFHHVALDDAMPGSGIPNAIAEDGDGSLWVGSDSGMARWDGFKFRLYQPDPKRRGSLPDPMINVLHRDSAGRRWVGTSAAGLARYDRSTDSFISYGAGPKGLGHVSVTALADAQDHGLWVGTPAGLDHLEASSGAIRRESGHGLPDGGVDALMEDRAAGLWVGGPQGLFHRTAAQSLFTRVSTPDRNGKTLGVTTIAEDAEGRLWLAVGHNGVYVLDRGGASARPVPVVDAGGAVLRRLDVESLVEGARGEILASTYGQGLFLIHADGSGVERITHDILRASALPQDTVRILYKGRDGLVWVGTNRSISHFDPAQKAILTVVGALGEKREASQVNVKAAQPDPTGLVWTGSTDNGVSIVDPVRGLVGRLAPDPLRPDRALPAVSITAFAFVPGGRTYIATQRGLYEAAPTSDRKGAALVGGRHLWTLPLRRLDFSNRDAAAAVWRLFLDGDTLWIGARDGLWTLDVRDRHAHLLRPLGAQALTDQRIKALAPAAGGGLWIGTQNGLNHLDPSTGRVERILPNLKDPGGLAAGFVATLATDRLGRLWVGTTGGGVAVMTRDVAGRPRFHRLAFEEGLPNPNVDKIVEDRRGRIWASTDGGLAVIDPTTFNVRALRRAEGVAVSSYWSDAGGLTRDGDILFGGLGGLTVVHPDALTDTKIDPAVVVTDVKVGGKAAPSTRYNAGSSPAPLVISPNANTLAVQFAVLSFSAPERSGYAYRLEGYDAGWNRADPEQRTAAYTNLPPGDYVLRLRGTDRDGAWNAVGPDIPIRVLPAWHQTWWFRSGVALASMGLVIVLVQARTRTLRTRERQLERLVADRTAELSESRNELEKIAYLDALTDLGNRRMFTDDIRKLIAHSRRSDVPFALILLDLDRFKEINDTFGHDAGDALLVETAARLLTVVRETDRVARLGGDEFAVLVSDARDLNTVETICRRIVESYRHPVLFRDLKIGTTPSLGVAFYPRDGETHETLYKAADLALYDAKKAGRNTWRIVEAPAQAA